MFIPDGITSASHPPRMRGLKHTIREGIISLCLRGRQRSSLSRILPIKQIFCRAGIYRRANFDCKLCKYNDDKYPYGKPQTDEVARGSGNREYGCRRLREKLPNFSGVSFFRAGNSSNRVNAFHICVYVHRCAVPRYIALQHP